MIYLTLQKRILTCSLGQFSFLCLKDQTLSQLVQDRVAAWPASGEINSKLADPKMSIDHVYQHFAPLAQEIDHTDGISMSFENWRFNLRSSNTEPVVRLNVESRGDELLMKQKTSEIMKLLSS